jgi:uncharacterized protein YkwD
MHPPPILSLAFAPLLVLAIAPRAEAAAPPSAKPVPAISTALVEAIQDLLEQSDERFKANDFRASNRLLEGGLRILRGVLADRPELRKQIDGVLARAAEETKGSVRTTLYRAVLVRILREQNQRQPAAAKASQKPGKTGEPEFRLSKDEKALLDLTNKQREKEGLRPLRASAKLFEAARKHSANMAGQERLAHTLDGKGPGERLREEGYRSFGWAENCAAGQRTPADAIDTWMNSPGHRRNMLDAQYIEVGLGITVSENGTRFWTQVFAVPARP